MSSTEGAIILDVDGTLVDTNYHHALAWFRAFRRDDIIVPLWRIHRHMGMGGDQLVKAVAGREAEEQKGDSIRAAEKALYAELMGRSNRSRLRTSSSRTFEPRAVRSCWPARRRRRRSITTSTCSTPASSSMRGPRRADVKATKPEPDLILAAMEKVGASTGVMIGDSVFDCIAAGRVGIPSPGLLTGGFSREELLEAGAQDVCASLKDLRTALLDG